MATGSIELGRPSETLSSDFVTVVLPCLNEEASVGMVVEEAMRTLQDAGIPGEVLVVDNGSDDRSVEIAHQAGARVVHEERRGYGRAVRTGIEQALGSIVVMADADWTYDMTKLPLLIDPVRRGLADLSIGSRLHEANRQSMPVLHKYVGTPALTAFIRTAGGYTDLTDSQSGFRCFRKDKITELRLRADGMELTSEMLLKSSRLNLTVVEVPTGYRKRIGISKLNTFKDGWRNLRVLAGLAPELFFLAPGSVLFLLGTGLTITAFLPSHGVQIGSIRWQPIFFATIALVLGVQAILAGLVFAWRRSPRAGKKVGPALRLISAHSFPPACSMLGASALLIGLALDALLFLKWTQGQSGTADLPTASLAQSLLLVGGTLATFGLVVMWLHWEQRQQSETN